MKYILLCRGSIACWGYAIMVMAVGNGGFVEGSGAALKWPLAVEGQQSCVEVSKGRLMAAELQLIGRWPVEGQQSCVEEQEAS